MQAHKPQYFPTSFVLRAPSILSSATLSLSAQISSKASSRVTLSLISLTAHQLESGIKGRPGQTRRSNQRERWKLLWRFVVGGWGPGESGGPYRGYWLMPTVFLVLPKFRQRAFGWVETSTHLALITLCTLQHMDPPFSSIICKTCGHLNNVCFILHRQDVLEASLLLIMWPYEINMTLEGSEGSGVALMKVRIGINQTYE